MSCGCRKKSKKQLLKEQKNLAERAARIKLNAELIRRKKRELRS